jgi:alkylation response protein AidB-like acyl-CoA dehydrogenase
MALLLNSEQQMLRDAAASFLAERSPVAAQRRLRDEGSARGFDPALWQQVAELGWPAAVFPEAEGGLALGWKGLGAVAECLGTHLCATPMLSSVVLCGSLLLDAGSPEQRARWLPGVIDGSRLLALALEESARHAPASFRCQARPQAGAWVLDGEKQFVIDGPGADHFIVATGPDTRLWIVDAAAPGVSVRPVRLVDSRMAASVRFESVRVGPQDELAGAAQADQSLDAALDRARILLAAEGLGLMRAAFATTVDYLKQRVQFDVPIGSFQALQHRAARLYVGLELLESCVNAALDALYQAPHEVPLLASLAKAQASDLSERLLNEAVQMHGGIGVTDEYDLGLFLKRGRVLQQTLGDGAFHRDRYARLKGF